jgi:hypothetical protein
LLLRRWCQSRTNSSEFYGKIYNTHFEEESGCGIKGFELTGLAPGCLQWLAIGHDHVTIGHYRVANLNMLERVCIQ